MTREQLPDVVFSALTALGGKGTVARVAEQIWKVHESALRSSGDLYYTWQYDIRWAAQKLRDQGKLVHLIEAGRRYWQLKGS